VSSNGTATPATVSFPGAYANTDPGIYFNLYTPFSTYVIPGPTVYVSGMVVVKEIKR
jgi:lytic cellulose monooxygenase (C1-hydroxylating)